MVFSHETTAVCSTTALCPTLNFLLTVFRLSENFVKQLSWYEIITPLRVNDFGESFPHKLHYRRRRRSLNDHLSGLRVHYRIDAFGERFHLNLTAHSDFIAPSYTVLHLGAEQSNGTEPHSHDSDMRHCFFRGHVNDRREYPAVFSLCTGLVSIAALKDFLKLFLGALIKLCTQDGVSVSRFCRTTAAEGCERASVQLCIALPGDAAVARCSLGIMVLVLVGGWGWGGGM